MEPDLTIRHNIKGRGVYAARRFRKGELVCANTVLVWSPFTRADAFIGNYLWSWQGREALALGLISLFNHSDKPNTGSQRRYRQKRIVCNALRDIRAGEEILIDYGGAAEAFEVLE